MSDATELVERLSQIARYLEQVEADTDWSETVDAGRAWIERWAPVVDAEIEFRRLDKTNAPREQRFAAGIKVEKAITAALGEDKP